ncbi:hypothetical protein C5C17_05920 [Pseudoclavibacter sp. RFBA6]|nr:hypothetical protein C5C17_05920 [Pseudoclavibacter sp. RFBA6]
MHSEPRAYNLPVTSSPYLVNIATIVGKAGTMRTLELDFDAPERIGEGLGYIEKGTPIELDVRLEVLHDGILATASLESRMSGECSRCLTPLDEPLRVDFAELFAYARDEALEYEVHDDTVDLEPPVRDAVVLALPFQPVCRPDCLGLDPETGEKLVEPLEEQAPAVDPRWAALAGFGASTGAAEEPATGSEEVAGPRETESREDARNHDYKGEPGQR